MTELKSKIHYKGYSKHKKAPEAFGLPPYMKRRGDATLCDEHAGFRPVDMGLLPSMLERGLKSGLVGKGDIVWTVFDNGWIMECRVTNRISREYHGYPVRPGEAIAEGVYRRFAAYVRNSRSSTSGERAAMVNCKAMYETSDEI
ncbi:hypothetical protein [Ramlibacter sp.]|uniref:hypothetical protein n=1 Tax=Ramlibacter sp. TaxID=1917967 RepID=UPI003D0B19DC